MLNAKFAGIAVAVVAALGASTTAHSVDRVVQGNGANYCQSALPVFDGNVRKRPVSVQNEGDSNAFVTCAYHSEGPVFGAAVWVHADTAGDLTCTGVAGYNGIQVTSVKTVAMDGINQSVLEWSEADFPGGELGSGLFGVSCGLKPGQGVDDSYVGYDDGDVPPA